jgi:hypothetical protein
VITGSRFLGIAEMWPAPAFWVVSGLRTIVSVLSETLEAEVSGIPYGRFKGSCYVTLTETTFPLISYLGLESKFWGEIGSPARFSAFLIPSQCLDRIELCRFSGRKITKYDARQEGARECNDDRRNREDHAPARNRGC